MMDEKNSKKDLLGFISLFFAIRLDEIDQHNKHWSLCAVKTLILIAFHKWDLADMTDMKIWKSHLLHWFLLFHRIDNFMCRDWNSIEFLLSLMSQLIEFISSSSRESSAVVMPRRCEYLTHIYIRVYKMSLCMGTWEFKLRTANIF